MTHYAPGSQSQQVMAEKRRLAVTLLERGLTVTQVSRQLRCSTHFVRRARNEAAGETSTELSAAS